MTESFNAVLAEAMNNDNVPVLNEWLNRLAAAHAAEVAELTAKIESAPELLEALKEATRDQRDNAVARADAAMGLLRKARSRVADISQLGVEIDAFLAEQALVSISLTAERIGNEG